MMTTTAFTIFARLLLFALPLLAYICPVLAASSSGSATPTSASAAASASATIDPGSHGYTYIGCYNETTGFSAGGDVRALTGGTVNASNTMTVEQCFNICGDQQYAGLEYTRECWCGPYLNSQSVKLNDSECNLQCMGDKSEFCGGPLKLTLYQRKSGSSSSSSSSSSGHKNAGGFSLLSYHRRQHYAADHGSSSLAYFVGSMAGYTNLIAGVVLGIGAGLALY
ncbi:WSC-domain-containing protein [Xylona heveae TC161]|uniref:WSC-domain-containing protein n=1 Tax=Xylona heveae (strain CBS 132557 / TC161) TaxID=1328760 RepID=A0A165GMI8_XYLHT|nr:WSC-domain-containing protein [Xylona heveae TC161]KZF22373.1 WSC-domain-containing protein [Xylona heveae TC161]